MVIFVLALPSPLRFALEGRRVEQASRAGEVLQPRAANQGVRD